MKKRYGLLLAVIVGIAILLPSHSAQAGVDTCTWTGASDALWNNGANWSGCDNSNVPEPGDSLIFPEAASNKATTNDFVAYTFDSIQITGSGYTLNGTGLTLNATTPLIVNQSATIDINITYAPSMNAFIRVATSQTLTVTGTTTFSGVTGEVNVGGGGFAGTVDFLDNINGDAGTQFIAVNDAIIIVRGASNTYTASTVGAESDGRFECRSTTCFGDVSNDIYMGNGEVHLYATGVYSHDWQTSTPSAGDSWLIAHDNITISGDGVVNDSIGISQETDNRSLQFTGLLTLNGSASVFGSSTLAAIRFDGAVSGSEAFSIGGGTVYLSSNSTYAGTNTINAGSVVVVDTVTGLGNSTGVTNVLDGASLRFEYAAPQTINEPLYIDGSGIAGEGVLVQTDESVELSGNIQLNGDVTIGVDTTSLSSLFELSGVISGTGDITLTSSAATDFTASSIQFTGTSANSYVGTTIVSGVRFYPAKSNDVLAVTGDLQILATATRDSTVETSANESIANTSHVTVMNNGTNDAILYIGTNATETIGYITGDGEVSIGATSTLILSHSGDYTYAGEVSKFANFPAGVSVIRKQGSGIATFTGGINSSYGLFYPVLEVTAGQLKVNSANFSTAQTSILSGGLLKGTGTLGYVTIQAGAEMNVGNSPGCMTVSALDLTAGAMYTTEIAGTISCSGYDVTTVTGIARLNNANLNIILTTTPPDGTEFTIISAGSIIGTFNGLADDAVITVNGVQFRINYGEASVTLTKLSGTVTTTTTSPTLANTGSSSYAVSLISVLFITVTIVLSRRSRLTN